MERLCYTFEIVAGSEAEYDRMHHEIWPQLATAILDAGYRDYTLYRRGTTVICTCKCDPDIDTVRARMVARHSAITAEWNTAMEPLIAAMTDAAGDLIEYEEIWHLDEADR